MQFATELRAAGKTWPEAAAAVRRRYRVNARVAPRLARGLSQRQVAELWNQRWPDDPKTFKNISTWELWPASTGHAPSLDTLDRLAQLYECSVADLLADLPNHGHPPPHPPPAPTGPAPQSAPTSWTAWPPNRSYSPRSWPAPWSTGCTTYASRNWHRH